MHIAQNQKLKKSDHSLKKNSKKYAPPSNLFLLIVFLAYFIQHKVFFMQIKLLIYNDIKWLKLHFQCNLNSLSVFMF